MPKHKQTKRVSLALFLRSVHLLRYEMNAIRPIKFLHRDGGGRPGSDCWRNSKKEKNEQTGKQCKQACSNQVIAFFSHMIRKIRAATTAARSHPWCAQWLISAWLRANLRNIKQYCASRDRQRSDRVRITLDRTIQFNTHQLRWECLQACEEATMIKLQGIAALECGALPSHRTLNDYVVYGRSCVEFRIFIKYENLFTLFAWQDVKVWRTAILHFLS